VVNPGAPTNTWTVVSLKGSTQQALVTDPVRQGTCGNGPSSILEVHAAPTDIAQTITPLSETSPLAEAFDLQCGKLDVDELQTCLAPTQPGTAADQQPDQDSTNRAAGSQASLASFADRYQADEKRMFFAAVAIFDRPALSRAEGDGIFAHWGAQALAQLSTSALPLPEKRRRAAWLLARPRFIAELSEEMMVQLAQWLPTEDWTPVLRTLGCSSRVQEMRRELGDQIKPALERRIALFQQQTCK
jgi:hypothetical protein